MIEYTYVAANAPGQRTGRFMVTMHSFSGGGYYVGNCDRSGYPVLGLLVGSCSSVGGGMGHGHSKGNSNSKGRSLER